MFTMRYFVVANLLATCFIVSAAEKSNHDSSLSSQLAKLTITDTTKNAMDTSADSTKAHAPLQHQQQPEKPAHPPLQRSHSGCLCGSH